jgi:hypothetical protein
MTLNEDALLLIGFVLGGSIISLSVMLYRLLNIAVDEKEVVLVSRFGRLQRSIDVPGWHFMWDRSLPWVQVRRVSTRLECRTISGVVVNDARGTTVTVDVFLEFRILDPYKASFAVVDWERALTSLVSHSVTSALGNRQFEDILSDAVVPRRARCARRVDRRNQSLGHRRRTPDDSKRHGAPGGLARDDAFGCRAHRALEGRHRGGRPPARRAARGKDRRARSRSLSPRRGHSTRPPSAAPSRSLKASPEVCKAYNELYELSLMHPQRTIAFVGFAEGEIRPVDAAMIVAMKPGPSA